MKKLTIDQCIKLMQNRINILCYVITITENENDMDFFNKKIYEAGLVLKTLQAMKEG